MHDGPTVRFRATVEYDGTDFYGWQIQPDVRTVQGELEARLARLTNRKTRVHSAGRTDAGVHAVGQEAAFDAPDRWDAREMGRALDATLPDDVRVARVRAAEPDFHPRFDASARRYEYFLATGPAARTPLRRRRVWAVEEDVDVEILRTATEAVPGRRSFAAFAKSGQPGRGTVCRVREAAWKRTALGDLRFRVVADRFLHHMVRYLVKTLVQAATGHRGPDEVAALLAGGDARPPGPAPAAGLYLTGVRYPDGWNRSAGVPGLDLPDGERAEADGGPCRRAEESQP